MVYFICGAGGSGKDTLANDILLINERIKRGVIYTNRPKRDGEVDGETYRFRPFHIISDMIRNNKFIEYRKYKVYNDVWYYGTGEELLEGEHLLWGPYEMYLSIKNAIGDECKGIYLDVPIKDRAERMLNRAVSDLDVVEACRRVSSDYEDFRCVDKSKFDLVVKNSDGRYADVLVEVLGFIN